MNFIHSIFRTLLPQTASHQNTNPTGFGTFYGVFVPNVTMMFGVILFMRLGLVVGNVGMWQFSTILLLSLVVMLTTSLSIAMIVTNMRVGGGGVYYLLSRSLGMEVGGAIGIALVLSQIFTVAVCTTGFAYSLSNLLQDIYPGVNLVTIEMFTLLILSFLAFASADLALKTQLIIFAVLIVGVISVFFSKDISQIAFTPDLPFFSEGLKFWEAFALFYPALTGIEAGMGLSGNLKNPSRSLWLGSFLSLVFVAIVYFLIGSYLAFSVPSENLKNSPMILLEISRIPQLIYLGIWGATLSSSLGALIGGPRMFQSIADDGIVPSVFGKTFGKYQEPRYALALTFFISLTLMIFTTIDQIIPIQAMICLISYGTLNIFAGLAELIHSPRWRPTVRIPWWICLFGGGLCIFLMFMINPLWSFLALFSVTAIYFSLRFLSLDVSFQDFRENIIFFFSRFAIYHLSKIEEHAHHWHPQLLVFSNSPTTQSNMICLASSITRRSGILSVASILPISWEDEDELLHMKKAIEDYLSRLEVSCLVETHAYSDPIKGIENLIKSYGLGSLQPNTIMMYISPEDELEGVIRAIEISKAYSKNIILFKDSTTAPLKLFKTPYIQRKRIDIWWDNDYTGSFELILSFIHTLTSGLVWKYAHINLRGVFPDDSTKQHLKSYFNDFIKHSRVRMKFRLYVEGEAVTPLDKLEKYSGHADLVVLPLRPIEDSPDDYHKYLKSLIKKLPDETPFVLVTCYDNLDHREIYIEEYPQ